MLHAFSKATGKRQAPPIGNVARMVLAPLYDWTRQGTDGFLGHDRCQGPTSGLAAGRHGALILMGVWCGAQMADTTRRKTGVRRRLPVGGGVCQAERNRKKWSKVV